jgi:hypothetical protein
VPSPISRGWPNPYSPGFERNIITVTAGGVSIRVHKAVEQVWRYVLTELGKHYPLAGKADDWGWARRPIRGYEPEWERTHDPKYLSNHSWGFAGDLDSTDNPMTTDTKAQHEFVAAVIDPILAPFGGRLKWGGAYKGTRKDYMHLEWEGTPEQAAADNQLALRLLTDQEDTVSPEDHKAIAQLVAAEMREDNRYLAQFLAGRPNRRYNKDTVGIDPPPRFPTTQPTSGPAR